MSPGILSHAFAFLDWPSPSAPWGAYALDLGALALLAGAAWGPGALLSRPPAGPAGFVLAQALGLGVLSLLTFLLGLAGWAGTGASWAVLAAGLAVGALAPRPSRAKETPPRWSILERLLAACAGFALLLHLVGALAPETFYDAQVYHLAGPDQYRMAGRIRPLVTTLYTHFPQNVEMLYLLMLSVRGETAAKLVHWWLMALTTAGIAAFGRAAFGRRAGLAAAALFAAVPMTAFAAWHAGVELGAALWGLCGAWLLARALEPAAERRTLLLSGALYGLAMGAKYTELWAALAGAAVLVRRPRALLPWGLAAAGVLAPWLIKNLAFAGNPVAPFLTPDAAALATDARGHFWHGGALSWKTWLLTPWQLFMKGRSPFSFVGPVLLLFAPLVLLARRAPAQARLFLLLFGLHYALWASSTSMARLLIPALPLWCLFVAAALESLPRLPWAALVLPVAGWNLCWNQSMLEETRSPAVVFGRTPRAAYAAEPGFGHPAPLADLASAVAALPPQARLMLVGDARRYPLPRPAEAAGPFEQPRLLSWLAAASRPEELAERLASEGFTHVVFNKPEFERLWLPKLAKLGPDKARLLDAFAGTQLQPVARGRFAELYALRVRP